MRTHTKLLFSGLAAALLLSLAVNGASASRLLLNESKFYVIWRPLQVGEAFLFVEAIRCAVTLLGSFHSRLISKVPGQLIGYIAHATNAPRSGCIGGEMTVLQETLPWHIQYDSFSASEGLPRIRTVRLRLIGAAFRIHSTSGITCLYLTSASEPFKGDIGVEPTSGIVTLLAALREFKIRAHERTSELCPEPGEIQGNAQVTAGTESSTTKLVIRLVQ
jgi:hypothetical protein